jgi:hypothetical protein
METALRDGGLTVSEVLDGFPAPRRDDDGLRASIRAMRAADGLLLGVLDDDPTGSQAVHGVQVVTVLDEDAYAAAFDGPARTCFVLTNSRSLGEPAAAELTARAARGLIAVAARRGVPIDLISRSDSTLRGHVLAEVAALAAVRGQEATGRRATGRGATGRAATGREASGLPAGRGPDAVLLIPAFV